MRTIAFSFALLATSGVSPLGQQTAGTGWTPVLQVRAVSATPKGSTVNASGDWKMVKDGEPLAMSFWTGSSLCVLGTARGTEPPPAMSPGKTLWTLTGHYLGEHSGRHEVRLTSRFARLGGREGSAATTQTLELQEGDEVTLDAITEPLDSDCKVHAITFDARVMLQPSEPVLARTRYTADLWLVHNGPFQAQMHDRLMVNVDGTAPMPFRFGLMTFTLPQVDPRQGNIAGAILVTGSIRARTRTDGQIALDIETNRLMYGLSNLEEMPLLAPVRETLTLTPGETMAVDFPPPSRAVSTVPLDSSSGAGSSGSMRVEGGRGRVDPPAGVPGEVVTVKGNRLTVDTGMLFKGHKTQLLITLKPLR